MAPRDPVAEEYARDELVKYMVAKGIDPGLARSVVEKNVTTFTSVEINGTRHLMVLFAFGGNECWPAFNKGVDNPHAAKLGDALFLLSREEMQRRHNDRLSGAIGKETSADDDSPYLDEPPGRAEHRRRIAGSF